jgi:O-antigen ligase
VTKRLPGEVLAVWGVFLLAAWPAWLRGGTVPRLMLPLPLAAVILLAMWMLVSGRLGGGGPGRLLRDPVFYLGLAFLGLVALQWWNAGRVLDYGGPSKGWFYGEPPRPGWPSAIAREDAGEMWTWFMPAAVMLWLVRAGVRSRQGAERLLVLLVVNAALLAVFGIVQVAAGADAIYGHFPTGAHFFASFGYANHAGEFFVLMFAVSCGLALRSGRGRGRWGFVTASMLCLAAVHFSLSRLAMLLGWALAGLALREFYRLSKGRLAPSTLLHVFLCVVAAACLLFYLVTGLAGGSVGQSMSGLSFSGVLRALGGGRWDQLVSALRLWADHPVWGAGGWSYRYLGGLYMPPEAWARITFNGEDANLTANVHNDLVQFLGEFGLAGVGLMLAGLAVTGRPLLRRGRARCPTALMMVSGLAATCVQSLVDLPFRCPAVTYGWLIVLALAARLRVEKDGGRGAGSCDGCGDRVYQTYRHPRLPGNDLRVAEAQDHSQ